MRKRLKLKLDRVINSSYKKIKEELKYFIIILFIFSALISYKFDIIDFLTDLLIK